MAVATHNTVAPACAPIPFLPMPPADIRPAANHFHQAGHTVATWWADHRSGRAAGSLQGVGFLANAAIAERMFGWAREDRRVGNDALARACEARVRVALVVAYAGPAAEARHLGLDVDETLFGDDTTDANEADRIAFTWFQDGPAAIAACDGAERDAVALVRSAAGWKAIEAVAGALQHRGEADRAEVDRLCAAAFA